MGTFPAVSDAPPCAPAAPLRAVVTVSCNKGGVGKTTLAANLAIYLRALREELPVAVVGLDDQATLDRMFALRPPAIGEGNLKHGWAERSLDRVLQLGQYGVHFVPSPPDSALLKARAEAPDTLRRILDCTEWRGVYILDTKSDLEALTRNALHAADRILVPVADWASLEEAAKTFALLERSGRGAGRARVVFTLVDRRSRVGLDGTLFERLEREVRRRGWPRYDASISRSPRVESLNSGTSQPLSILHHARGTAVHTEMHALARELLRDLEGSEGAGGGDEPRVLWGSRVPLAPAREPLKVEGRARRGGFGLG
jgi:chromosome partitioning protein